LTNQLKLKTGNGLKRLGLIGDDIG